MYPASNDGHIISWYVNEIRSWESCHYDQHEKSFQRMPQNVLLVP